MNNGYTIIPDSFLDLQLDLTEITILSVIYGFSQDGDSTFEGSWNYLARKAKCSRRKVSMALPKLVELGYVQKIDVDIHGVKFCKYKVNANCIGSACDAPGDGACDAHNNTINENIDFNRDIEKKSRAKFVKPSIADVAEYCQQRQNGIDAEEFFSHYESNGWMVGKTPMKDWKAAVITWEKKRYKTPTNRPQSQAQPRKSVLQHNQEVAQKLFQRMKEAQCDEQ